LQLWLLELVDASWYLVIPPASYTIYSSVWVLIWTSQASRKFLCSSSHRWRRRPWLIQIFLLNGMINEVILKYSRYTTFCYLFLLSSFTSRLSTNKQNKVYLPEEPFPHAFLVKNARLKHYTSTYAEGFSSDYRQPCVVFCGHPSLRFGDAVHFVQLWGNNPLHTVIFTGIYTYTFHSENNAI